MRFCRRIFNIPNFSIMKRLYIAIVLLALPVYPQVGIGTTLPTAALDVNGDVRIRSIPVHTALSVPGGSVMATDSNGNMQQVSAKTVVTSHLKSFVKGGFSASADQALALPAAGSLKIPFDYEEFDENDEYNLSTHTFTAQAEGVYSVNVQIKSTSIVSIATNFGVAIAKNGTITARQGFANIGVAFINITPPVREAHTLVKLAPNDTITFITYSNLVNIGLNSAKDETFFTICQVR